MYFFYTLSTLLPVQSFSCSVKDGNYKHLWIWFLLLKSPPRHAYTPTLHTHTPHTQTDTTGSMRHSHDNHLVDWSSVRKSAGLWVRHPSESGFAKTSSSVQSASKQLWSQMLGERGGVGKMMWSSSPIRKPPTVWFQEHVCIFVHALKGTHVFSL